MDICMSMPGGGPHKLNPGQCTDDGELIMCLMQAIVESPDSNKLDLDIVARWYKKWHNSRPFDLEETLYDTIKALNPDD